MSAPTQSSMSLATFTALAIFLCCSLSLVGPAISESRAMDRAHKTVVSPQRALTILAAFSRYCTKCFRLLFRLRNNVCLQCHSLSVSKGLMSPPLKMDISRCPGPCQPHQGKRSNLKTLSHLTWCWLRFWHPGPWSQPLLSWSLQGWSSLPSGFEGSCVPGLLGPSQKASQLVPVISTGNQVVQEIREATWRSSVQEPLWNYMNP